MPGSFQFFGISGDGEIADTTIYGGDIALSYSLLSDENAGIAPTVGVLFVRDYTGVSEKNIFGGFDPPASRSESYFTPEIGLSATFYFLKRCGFVLTATLPLKSEYATASAALALRL